MPVVRLGDTEARLDAVKDLQQHQPAPVSGPLADYLRQSAANAGFALSNVEPQNDDRVKITIATARPAALFSWIADLEVAGGDRGRDRHQQQWRPDRVRQHDLDQEGHMRRIRLRTGPAALFGAAFVIALIVLLPMRLALGWLDLGLSARRVSGSVWGSTLTQAHALAFDLGDVDAVLSPLDLLIGRARVDFYGDDATPFDGVVKSSRHRLDLDDFTASLASASAFAPLPVIKLDLEDVSVDFADGSCDRAEGRANATLAGGIGDIALPQKMGGAVRCEGNTLLLPLTSVAGTESLELRLKSDRSYLADLTMQTGDPQLGAKLQLAGFSAKRLGICAFDQGQLLTALTFPCRCR